MNYERYQQIFNGCTQKQMNIRLLGQMPIVTVTRKISYCNSLCRHYIVFFFKDAKPGDFYFFDLKWCCKHLRA